MAFDSTQHLRDHLARLTLQLAELDQMVAADPQLAPLAEEDRLRFAAEIQTLEETLQQIERGHAALAPIFNSCILEFRPGAGGDEAKIWMADLLGMYTRYALLKGLEVEAMDEAVIKVKGKQAYPLFRFESGVHRVQRVPATERQGRIHTSTASVAVLPEVPQQQVEIREEDLDWQFYRAGGKGGQNVNKVSTAVRLTHIPSGIVVTASQERQQAQNREFALSLLRSKLWEIEEEKQAAQLGKARSAIGRAQRAEKIRTYNFPQNRLTDHRIPQSWHDLDRRLTGDLDDVVTALQAWEKDVDSGKTEFSVSAED